jgi:hypothetical protein
MHLIIITQLSYYYLIKIKINNKSKMFKGVSIFKGGIIIYQ